jgi:hypothetical protein
MKRRRARTPYFRPTKALEQFDAALGPPVQQKSLHFDGSLARARESGEGKHRYFPSLTVINGKGLPACALGREPLQIKTPATKRRAFFDGQNEAFWPIKTAVSPDETNTNDRDRIALSRRPGLFAARLGPTGKQQEWNRSVGSAGSQRLGCRGSWTHR